MKQQGLQTASANFSLAQPGPHQPVSHSAVAAQTVLAHAAWQPTAWWRPATQAQSHKASAWHDNCYCQTPCDTQLHLHGAWPVKLHVLTADTHVCQTGRQHDALSNTQGHLSITPATTTNRQRATWMQILLQHAVAVVGTIQFLLHQLI